MARTKAYQRQVSAKINTVNRKLRDIEKTFGTDSEQYQRYVNATTAALPPDAYTLTEAGRLKISSAASDELKLGQLRSLTKLPTAHKSMIQAKLSLAQNKLRAAGVASPSDQETKTESRNISDEEALRELAAKAFIEGEENEKGRLKYSEEVRADMMQRGVKTYTQLQEIIQKGKRLDEANEAQQKRAEQRKQRAKEYRERNRERRAEYQRQYRQRNREEVNRKQREYRARRAADKRLEEQLAERERNYSLRRR